MTWLTILVVVVTMRTPTDATVTAQRLVNWYAARGIPITATVGTPLVLAVDSCAEPDWWRDLPQVEGTAYLYLVDQGCWIYGRWAGVAMTWLDVALVRWPVAAFDVVVAHEVGHLLGAYDHPYGMDIMSPNAWQAYVDGQLDIRSWSEMGGIEPSQIVVLPGVLSKRKNSDWIPIE